MENTPLYPVIKFNTAHSETISAILNQLDAFDRGLGNKRLNLRPTYQRGEAWDDDFKEKLVYSLVTNYPIGNFVFRTVSIENPKDPTHEVVDGQQRLIAVREFIRKDRSLSASMSRAIISENKAYYEFDKINNINDSAVKIYTRYLKNPNLSIRLQFKNLPTVIQQQILEHNLNIIDVEGSDEAISQYFRFIQNQERLRAGEIINSIPDSPLRYYLQSINKNDFIDKTGWKESRKEFDKIFYSMIGIFDGKLTLGTTDKAIIDFVVSTSETEEYYNKNVESMIRNINAIAATEMHNTRKLTKRALKFFFLIAGFELIDFTTEIGYKYFKYLLYIDSLIPVFNSSNQKQIDKKLAGFDETEINDLRKIFLLGRGSHSTTKVIEVLYSLANLIIKKNR
ncbi:MAG: DUF262 domain-containing protein [Spirochaetales bacterium]|nr:DUF262 domain-containing protein [Spirochaetales bacterium]